MKNYANFEQSKTLAEKSIYFDEPKFGDLFYTIHPDTNTIDNVLVGSAKWHISAMLPMCRAPSLQDLIKFIGIEYRIAYDAKNNLWTIEKVKIMDFTIKDFDYMVYSFPVKTGECPITIIVELIEELQSLKQKAR